MISSCAGEDATLTTNVWREWRDALAILLAGAVLCFVLDAVAFRTKYYTQVLDPHSSAGNFESAIYVEAHREYWARPVLVVGNSLMVQGFSPRLANWLQEARGYQFSSVAVPGNWERCWYYLLRDLDPQRSRYSVIVIPVESYDDRDLHEEDLADRTVDAHFLAMHLRVTDIPEFAASFRSLSGKMEALKLTLLKGLVYRHDMQAFLAHPRDRIAEVRSWRRSADWNVYMYDGVHLSLAGLSQDPEKGTILFPEGLGLNDRQAIRDYVFERVPPQREYLAEYQRLWLGRIVARYRGTKTRILFLRPPMKALPRRDVPPQTGRSAIREFASGPGILLMDEHAFDDLERPELFYDFQHLNAVGREQFTTKFVKLFARALHQDSVPFPEVEVH